ncbi:hypothetical protein DFH09DRAFT_325242 [Mycena vulgaris]|nr:hypothetical protein DFH09DRAFT_325242 [Mycena vulgaris]
MWPYSPGACPHLTPRVALSPTNLEIPHILHVQGRPSSSVSSDRDLSLFASVPRHAVCTIRGPITPRLTSHSFLCLYLPPSIPNRGRDSGSHTCLDPQADFSSRCYSARLLSYLSRCRRTVYHSQPQAHLHPYSSCRDFPLGCLFVVRTLCLSFNSFCDTVHTIRSSRAMKSSALVTMNSFVTLTSSQFPSPLADLNFPPL